MKEIKLLKVDGGFIITSYDPDAITQNTGTQGQKIVVRTTLGASLKDIRNFFNDELEDVYPIPAPLPAESKAN